jgi:hypothetical protein
VVGTWTRLDVTILMVVSRREVLQQHIRRFYAGKRERWLSRGAQWCWSDSQEHQLCAVGLDSLRGHEACRDSRNADRQLGKKQSCSAQTQSCGSAVNVLRFNTPRV